MAKDFFHTAVVNALQKEDWKITHDPYELKMDTLQLFDTRMQIDLGAEKLIAAEKATEKIAVEIKSLLGPSLIYDLHNMVGQYFDYQIGLEAQEADRILFAAIPEIAYNRLSPHEFFKRVIQKAKIRLIIFDPELQTIKKWIP